MATPKGMISDNAKRPGNEARHSRIELGAICHMTPDRKDAWPCLLEKGRIKCAVVISRSWFMTSPSPWNL